MSTPDWNPILDILAAADATGYGTRVTEIRCRRIQRDPTLTELRTNAVAGEMDRFAARWERNA